MDSFDIRVHECVASYLHKQHLLNMSVLARFCLTDLDYIRQPWITAARQRVHYSYVRLAMPYIYIKAGQGVQLTDADRRANAVVSVTYGAVCPYWRRCIAFGTVDPFLPIYR